MRKHLSVFLVALLGGFLGTALGRSPAVQAQEQSQGLWVVGPDKRDRIQVATYQRGGERGLPLVGLFDNRSQLRLLLRLAGSAESPVLVFKDRNGRDRMVLGLGLNDEEPFLATVDGTGHKTNVFGRY